MRSDEEVQAVIRDMEFTLGIPGDGGPNMRIMEINLHILKWFVGEDAKTDKAFAALKEAVQEGKRLMERERIGRDRRN